MQPNLPNDKRIAVELLAACFSETTNSYKFYWLMAILEELNLGHRRIAHADLALRMISLAWYPLDYFKLSFGKRDGFVIHAKMISANVIIDKRVNAPSIYHQIISHSDEKTKQVLLKGLLELTRWVPYRFIRPFFSAQLMGLGDGHVNARIKKLAAERPGFAPYQFDKKHIVVDEAWAEYLQRHQYMLIGFTQWHLLRFLQRNNSNVIGLSEKLSAPGIRKLANAKVFWSSFLKGRLIRCIYCGDLLEESRISLDHFIPWSYIAHDRIWNIIPTTSKINSAKGNALPELKDYFEPYSNIQFSAFDYQRSQNNPELLEDYHQLLQTEALMEVDYDFFKEKLFLEVSTHHRIASAMGFSRNFRVA